VPTLCVGLALVIFAIAQLLDRAAYAGWIRLPHWLNQGSAQDMRDLLSATAGAIITTLGLVLSITVLTLSIAATQFGQRLLRRYMRDRGTQVSIGVFAATFIFSLLTLLSVTSRLNEHEYVPWLSAWISTLLAVLCIGVLIYFVHHIAQTIQVQHVIVDISGDLRRTVRVGNPMTAAAVMPDLTDRADYHLTAPCTGYLSDIDHDLLAAAAAECSVIIQFLHRPGEFVMEGVQLAAVVSTGSNRAQTEPPARLTNAFCKAVRFSTVRTIHQNPRFGIDQIVEIALRAMSEGVNDPFTMFACADWLADGLRFIAAAPAPAHVHADHHGDPRVIVPTPSFAELVRASFDPLRGVVRNFPRGSIHLLETIELLAPLVPPEHAPELRHQAEQIREGLDDLCTSGDRADVEIAYQHAMRALADRSPPRGHPVLRMVGP
jgi:uncharacterized membrane protein